MQNLLATLSASQALAIATGEDTSSDTAVRLASAVFNTTHEAIVVTDPMGTIIAVNPAFSATTGYAPAEAIGKSMRAFQSGRQTGAFYRDMWDHVASAGSWQGEIWNKRKNGEIYPALLTISSVRDRSNTPTHYIGTSADLTRIRKSELKLDHLAHHDELTGLPNRRLLTAHLQRAIERAARDNTTGAIIFIDLDRFKIVNDSLGHNAGDDLLQQVADRLRHALGPQELLARFGGDEFVVLMEQAKFDGASALASDLIERLNAAFVLSSGDEIYVGASVGISFYPMDGTSPSQVLQHADAALYQAKSAGRSTYRHYSSRLTAAANQRLSIEAGLRRAIAANELVVHYQPLVSLQDRHVFGFEALVRWHHPQRGLIPPADFLPVAEDTGLIVPIGQKVLHTACAQMKVWRDQGLDLSTIAVNISARQFRHPNFAASVAEVLDAAGLAAPCLELEITEGTLMGNDEATLSTLHALKALGVKLAIDDFGTGYSSLAYLKKLPVDKLKIDRTFVTDIEFDSASAAIATAIVGLARCLGMEVLAEGIQTQQQCERLLASGCPLGQGYLFARPIPPEAVDTLRGLTRSPAL